MEVARFKTFINLFKKKEIMKIQSAQKITSETEKSITDIDKK